MTWTLSSLGSLFDGPPSKTHDVVRLFVAERRKHPHLAPSYFAAKIATSPSWPAFPHAADWLQFKEPEDWRLIPCSTTAEELVKRQGRGGNGHWSDEIYGEWVPDRYDPPPVKPATKTAFEESP